jgi:hypothetical protein
MSGIRQSGDWRSGKYVERCANATHKSATPLNTGLFHGTKATANKKSFLPRNKTLLYTIIL